MERYTDEEVPFNPEAPDAQANFDRADAKLQASLGEEAKMRHRMRNISLTQLAAAGVVWTGATCATCKVNANIPWRRPRPFQAGWLCRNGHWTPYTAKAAPIHEYEEPAPGTAGVTRTHDGPTRARLEEANCKLAASE